MNCPRWSALWFAYILMHGKEAWVLVYLCSQCKCVERALWPVFPVYLTVSSDYVLSKVPQFFKKSFRFSENLFQSLGIENVQIFQ